MSFYLTVVFDKYKGWMSSTFGVLWLIHWESRVLSSTYSVKTDFVQEQELAGRADEHIITQC